MPSQREKIVLHCVTFWTAKIFPEIEVKGLAYYLKPTSLEGPSVSFSFCEKVNHKDAGYFGNEVEVNST